VQLTLYLTRSHIPQTHGATFVRISHQTPVGASDNEIYTAGLAQEAT
jgi:hypothetical protein